MTKKLIIKNKKSLPVDNQRVDVLYLRVASHIDDAPSNIQKTIDIEMVKAYWQIGKEIVEEEQHGQEHAEYGKAVLESLAIKLQAKYARGFSVDKLEQARKFYLVYQLTDNSKSDALRRKSNIPDFNQNLS